MLILIDGDIVAYRCGFATENERAKSACNTTGAYLAEMLTDLCSRFGLDADELNYQVFLTGSTNFRNDVAVTAPYKGNRKATPKPKHLQAIRDYLVTQWDAIISDNEEADDLIAIWATDDEAVIASLDKDFDQVPGQHYNFVKKELYNVTDNEAVRFFYTQLLTGDRVDNIIGLKGIGPVKAAKALADLTTDIEMYNKVVEMYDGDKVRVLENARLLWLRRTPGEMWEAPE